MTQGDNFLHKTLNVKEWMKTQIEKFVTEKGYKIVAFDIDSEVMTRLDKITIFNTLKLKMTDSEGNIISLDNYNSMGNQYESNETKWLIDFIKEREMEAILKYGGKALGSEDVPSESNDKLQIKIDGKKTHDNIKIELFMASKVSEIVKIFTDSSCIRFWAGPSGKFENGSVFFENVEIRNIQGKDDVVTFEYKWNDWKEYSFVTIKVAQVGDNVKVSLLHKNVPVELAENVKSHWNYRIFNSISTIFRCAIKTV